MNAPHDAAGSIICDLRSAAVVDGKASTRATFSQAGVYTIRAYADDGILVDAADIVVTVK